MTNEFKCGMREDKIKHIISNDNKKNQYLK